MPPPFFASAGGGRFFFLTGQGYGRAQQAKKRKRLSQRTAKYRGRKNGKIPKRHDKNQRSSRKSGDFSSSLLTFPQIRL